jgi:hypothetical protein
MISLLEINTDNPEEEITGNAQVGQKFRIKELKQLIKTLDPNANVYVEDMDINKVYKLYDVDMENVGGADALIFKFTKSKKVN